LQYMNESANDFKVMLKIYFFTHPTITCKQEFFFNKPFQQTSQ
jgi:hypothetical protein